MPQSASRRSRPPPLRSKGASATPTAAWEAAAAAAPPAKRFRPVVGRLGARGAAVRELEATIGAAVGGGLHSPTGWWQLAVDGEALAQLLPTRDAPGWGRGRATAAAATAATAAWSSAPWPAGWRLSGGIVPTCGRAAVTAMESVPAAYPAAPPMWVLPATTAGVAE